MRAMMSVEPPAGNGTMNWIGRVGQSSAAAAVGRAMTNVAAATNAIPIVRRLNIRCFLWSSISHSPSIAFVVNFRAGASSDAAAMRTPLRGLDQIDRARPGLMAVFLRHANEDGDVARSLRGAGDVMRDVHRGDLLRVRQPVDPQLAA